MHNFAVNLLNKYPNFVTYSLKIVCLFMFVNINKLLAEFALHLILTRLNFKCFFTLVKVLLNVYWHVYELN